ncbi:hypothetical protein C8R43DRAFT_965648 [Mycena crocata]|nr:hypothetical protein C8R43DRAFT_965648 [Mycena crocata]
MSSSRTIEPSSSASTSLPEGELTGYYVRNSLLYRVSQGDREIVLDTPIPEAKPPIDSNIRDPDFREPRYISYQYPYLIFVPKYYAWRDPVFKVLDCSYSKIPIVGDRVGGFYLHPNVAEEMRDLENSLRGLGREILSLARNSIRKLGPELAAWFFPARFKFLQRFFTEKAARFAVWRSIQNFLPASREVKALAPGTAPDWRSVVIARTELKRTFLDAVEGSVAGNWDMPRVGGMFCVRPIQDVPPQEREVYRETLALLASISSYAIQIPLYLSLGPLPTPKDMGRFRKFEKHLPTAGDKDLEKHPFMPDDMELKNLASPKGQFKFSRYTIGYDGALRRDPYSPPPIPVAPAGPAHPARNSPAQNYPARSSHAHTLAPFPPLPSHSKQKKNESISSFFIRRKGENEAKMAKESPSDQQRRNSRQAHAATGAVPSKACVFFWEEEDGHYIRRPGGRGTYAQLWQEYPAPQRRFDPISNEWDLCELFENNDPCWGGAVTHHHQDDDEDEDEDDDYAMYPTLDVTLSTLVPREDDTIDYYTAPIAVVACERGHGLATASCGDGMKVAQSQHYHDLDMVVADDVAEKNLGPDFMEEDLPKCDLAAASQRCMDLVFSRFGHTPRTAAPEYESCADTLLGTLKQRFAFGFPHPPSLSCLAGDRPSRDYASKLGSTIKDVGQHLVARGISFWLAYVSAEIMPACTPVSPWIRPKGFQADNISGLGFRPENYAFEEQDYTRLHHTARLSDTPYSACSHRLAVRRGHRAYGRGEGYVDSGHMRTWGTELTTDVAEQEQTRTVSWWPKPGAWARGSLDGAWWTPQCEDFFQKRLNQFGKKSTCFEIRPNGGTISGSGKRSKHMGWL